MDCVVRHDILSSSSRSGILYSRHFTDTDPVSVSTGLLSLLLTFREIGERSLQLFTQLKQLRKESSKKNSGLKGFQPMTSAMPMQCSKKLTFCVNRWIYGESVFYFDFVPHDNFTTFLKRYVKTTFN